MKGGIRHADTGVSIPGRSREEANTRPRCPSRPAACSRRPGRSSRAKYSVVWSIQRTPTHMHTCIHTQWRTLPAASSPTRIRLCVFCAQQLEKRPPMRALPGPALVDGFCLLPSFLPAQLEFWTRGEDLDSATRFPLTSSISDPEDHFCVIM